MAKAGRGDEVVVKFRVFTLDGRLIGGTQGDAREVLTLGAGKVFKAVEDGMVGMAEGEQKVIPVSAEQAFGPRRKELVLPIPKDTLPKEAQPSIGMVLPITVEDDVQLSYRVVDITDALVVLDANHPLAGEDLYFSVTLVEIRSA